MPRSLSEIQEASNEAPSFPPNELERRANMEQLRSASAIGHASFNSVLPGLHGLPNLGHASGPNLHQYSHYARMQQLNSGYQSAMVHPAIQMPYNWSGKGLSYPLSSTLPQPQTDKSN